MREGPLLCTATSIVSILKERKTRSRRVVKFSSPDPHRAYPHAWEHLGGGWVFATCPQDRRIEVGDEGRLCPYGKVGDRLWVKEAWRTAASLDDKTPKQIAKNCADAGYQSPWCPVMYEADGALDN